MPIKMVALNNIFGLIIFIILTILQGYSSGATAIIENDAENLDVEPKGVKPMHFVLVHGACHGGWSWYKLRTMLESAGHKVSSPDLLSAGIEPSDANTIFSFKDYNKPVHDILSTLPFGEKVIIVGHSFGGESVSNAIQYFPDKIIVGIYVVGQMVRNKTSSQHEHQILIEEPKFKWLEDVYDFFYGQGRDNPPTSGIFKKEIRHELLYNKSPLQDFTLASMLLKPFPMRASDSITNGSSKVPRVFIRTLHDNLYPIEKQNNMIKKWPPSDVYTVDSDHCPMLSNPSQLFDVLIKVANKFSTPFMDIE